MDEEEAAGFSEYTFPQKGFALPVSDKKYRIYTSETAFITIEATNALEAIRKSGITNPVRVEYENQAGKMVMAEEELVTIPGSAWDEADKSRLRRNIGCDVSGLIETDESGRLPE